MNKDNAKDYLPLVQALADGKTIQIKTVAGWYDNEDPTFTYIYDQYRIKPEPLECWVNVYPSCGVAYQSEQKAKENAIDDCKRVAVHMREVI